MSANYSAAFEAFWLATWRTGAKGDAQKAWLAHGKPTAEQAAPAIAAYLAAKRASGQSVQNVGVWLRAGGATQTEWRLATIGKSNAQPAQRPAPYHAPPAPLPQLPAGVDSAAEIERWRRERDQLAERKAAP